MQKKIRAADIYMTSYAAQGQTSYPLYSEALTAQPVSASKETETERQEFAKLIEQINQSELPTHPTLQELDIAKRLISELVRGGFQSLTIDLKVLLKYNLWEKLGKTTPTIIASGIRELKKYPACFKNYNLIIAILEEGSKQKPPMEFFICGDVYYLIHKAGLLDKKKFQIRQHTQKVEKKDYFLESFDKISLLTSDKLAIQAEGWELVIKNIEDKAKEIKLEIESQKELEKQQKREEYIQRLLSSPGFEEVDRIVIDLNYAKARPEYFEDHFLEELNEKLKKERKSLFVIGQDESKIKPPKSISFILIADGVRANVAADKKTLIINLGQDREYLSSKKILYPYKHAINRDKIFAASDLSRLLSLSESKDSSHLVGLSLLEDGVRICEPEQDKKEVHNVWGFSEENRTYHLDDKKTEGSYYWFKNQISKIRYKDAFYFDDVNKVVYCLVPWQYLKYNSEVKNIIYKTFGWGYRGAVSCYFVPPEFPSHLKRINRTQDVYEGSCAEFFNQSALREKDFSLRPQIKDVNDLLNHSFCVGEVHSAVSPKKFLIQNMQKLAENGYKTLFMEHYLYDSMQEDLDSYFKSPLGAAMPEALKRYSVELGKGHSPNYYDQSYNFLEVIVAAKKAGIRVVAIDTDFSYKMGDSDFGSRGDERMKGMNYAACHIIKKEAGEGKWVALMGSAHTNAYCEVKGVPEILGVPSVEICDSLDSKQVSIELDARRVILKKKIESELMIKARIGANLEFDALNILQGKESDDIILGSSIASLSSEEDIVKRNKLMEALIGNEELVKLKGFFVDKPESLESKVFDEWYERNVRKSSSGTSYGGAASAAKISFSNRIQKVKQIIAESGVNEVEIGMALDALFCDDRRMMDDLLSKIPALEAKLYGDFVVNLEVKDINAKWSEFKKSEEYLGCYERLRKSAILASSTSNLFDELSLNISEPAEPDKSKIGFAIENTKRIKRFLQPLVQINDLNCIKFCNLIHDDPDSVGSVDKFSFSLVKSINKKIEDVYDYAASIKDAINITLNVVNQKFPSFSLSKSDVAKFILIANKNGGISNVKDQRSLESDFVENFPGANVADMFEKAEIFSASFQEQTARQGLFTGNKEAKNFVGLRLKRIHPKVAEEILMQDGLEVSQVKVPRLSPSPSSAAAVARAGAGSGRVGY